MSELATALALVACTGFLAGYALGRRLGEKEGFVQGLHYAPIELRRAALEQGRCVICGSGPAPAPSGPAAGAGEERPGGESVFRDE